MPVLAIFYLLFKSLMQSGGTVEALVGINQMDNCGLVKDSILPAS